MNDTTNYSMDFYDSGFNTTAMLNSECWGEYSTIVLGVLLFISEVLPFLQKKSKCNEDVDVVDFDDELNETKTSEKIKRSGSLIHNSNGVLHTFLEIYKKIKK